MANKKHEDIEMGDDRDKSFEKEPFLARSNSQARTADGWANYFDKIDHSPGASIMAYCLSSISMTVVNKYVVSGTYWNLNFFYLAVQVCSFVPSSPLLGTAEEMD